MSAVDDSNPDPVEPEAEALQREREGQAAAFVLARSPAQLAAEATRGHARAGAPAARAAVPTVPAAAPPLTPAPPAGRTASRPACPRHTG
jgi:hypothetical protein